MASRSRGDQHKTPYRARLAQLVEQRIRNAQVGSSNLPYFVPGLAPHLHGFTLQVNGLTCGYAGTGPSNLYEVLQAAGVSEAQVAREDITQKSTKTIPLRLERAVTQYGDFQFA